VFNGAGSLLNNSFNKEGTPVAAQKFRSHVLGPNLLRRQPSIKVKHMTPSEIEPLHVLSQPENEEDCKVVTLGICIYVQLRITDGTSWSWISFAKKKRGRHCYTIYGVCHEVTFFEGEVTTEKMCPKSGCPTLMSLETCSFCL